MGGLGKLGVSTAVGILIGILAILWIKPDNAGGSVLIIVVCTAFSVIVAAVIRAVRGR